MQYRDRNHLASVQTPTRRGSYRSQASRFKKTHDTRPEVLRSQEMKEFVSHFQAPSAVYVPNSPRLRSVSQCGLRWPRPTIKPTGNLICFIVYLHGDINVCITKKSKKVGEICVL